MRNTCKPADLVLQPSTGAPFFVPAGEYRTNATAQDYLEEEWFATGHDDLGQPYTTQLVVRRPRDPARFSGVVIVEPLHIHRIAPIYMYCSPYILRSGHGWVCVAAQKTALDAHVKTSDPERYARLGIAPDTAYSLNATTDLTMPPFIGTDPATRKAWWDAFRHVNQATSAILAQVGAALRTANGPFESSSVRHMILAGHSQTGFVTTNYICNAHEAQRLTDGSPVFDGFFPSGWPRAPFGPCDVPILQVMSDGDISDPAFSFEPGFEGRRYRRDDADDPHDRYRLYELAGVPHSGTRYPPFSDPALWQQVATAGTVPLGSVMNSLPHHELFDMSLHHLVQWVAHGATPPRADRLALAPDDSIAKDGHGNSLGGVRCVQLDVPAATYYPNPLNPDGTRAFGTIGITVPFHVAEMQRLYGDPATYVRQFVRRLEDLIHDGWFLPDDADEMRAEARARSW